ncbi:YdeI/OmpD-associated family protein [Novosphingobium sp. TH158]|uniref:YdeI/OmpD-associated family protein n=1 Tax=Novosphingobium sp. TH158 TaxID=2067455 RepID=UPI000C7B594D|nr:YdeI/OmpD-associated family protein [Novosphingobium sp. TH158]PLK26035.1 hypothetical protein C0V78_03405 [Novosphingobium sp. TH158]
MQGDPRVDAYIDKSAGFAVPILNHFRALVGATVPDASETIKWGVPHFTLEGKILAGMAAHKAHASLIVEGSGERRGMMGDGMGNFGRITCREGMPSDDSLVALLQAKAESIRAGDAAPRPKRAPRPELPMPEDFARALAACPAAEAALAGFAPSHRRDYIEWITEAKRPETRDKRIAQAVAELAEGKKLYWKYDEC